MRNVIVVAVLLFLAYFVNAIAGQFTHSFGDEAVLVLGFVLISAFAVGRLVRRAKMPMITGYLLAGLLLGPHVIGRLSPQLTLFTPRIMGQLHLIDSIALGLIAFTAGGELRLADLKPRLRSIVSITASHTVIVFLGVAASVMLMSPYLSVTSNRSWPVAVAAAVLLGLAATAKSPATTIAVITETGASGPLTTVMMGVTILKDVVTLVLFSVGIVAARKLLEPSVGFELVMFLKVLWEVVGSLALGLALGVALRFYIQYVGEELPILVITLAFLATEVAAGWHLSGILICMAAGFYVENFTDLGHRLIAAVERYSLPIYIVFFTLAGAKIDVPALRRMWLLAVLLIVARLTFNFIGAWTGSRLAGGDRNERRLVWMGFIGQAGITLGLATMIGERIPVIGADLRTLIIATIAVNQMLGPILLRFALYRAGEAKR